MPQTVSPLALFSNKTFRMLWLAALTSNFGGLVQSVGAAWMMTTLSDKPSMVALVQSSVTLPIVIFSLLAGVLADSYDRRRVMLTAQSFMFVVSIALAGMAVAGLLSPWLLLGFTFMIGCGTALHLPSWQATMGDIVPKSDLPSAVALNSMGFNLMRSVGPAAGGAIVAVAGAAAAFAVNAASYVAIITALLRWHPAARPRTLPREPLGAAFAAGLRYVAMSPNLIRVILRGAMFGMASIAVLALLPLVVREHLDGRAFVYGIMLGCFGLGAVAGALLNARLRARFENEAIARGAFLALALASVTLALSGAYLLTGAALLLAGGAWVVALSMFNVTIQLSTPRWVVGRALALYQTGTFGGMAAGSWIAGLLAEAHGVDAAMLVAAAAMCLGAAAGRILPLPAFGVLDLDPLDRFREPPLRLDLTRRSGPIMVTVDYIIAQADVPAFLSVMALRRRIRLRDGARQWTLLRDLENPDVWTESYHVPTWVEYVRHNARRTQADLDGYERLLALHRGDAPPKVRRMIERQTVPLHDDTPLKPPA
ncbi:MAG: MFS transporter [Rhodobacteraceae bacterium]|nr:MFS transporter [Paracoccaceae bacterium]